MQVIPGSLLQDGPNAPSLKFQQPRLFVYNLPGLRLAAVLRLAAAKAMPDRIHRKRRQPTPGQRQEVLLRPAQSMSRGHVHAATSYRPAVSPVLSYRLMIEALDYAFPAHQLISFPDAMYRAPSRAWPTYFSITAEGFICPRGARSIAPQ